MVLGLAEGFSLPDPRKDPKSRSPKVGPYTTKGNPLKGSALRILPGVWVEPYILTVISGREYVLSLGGLNT